MESMARERLDVARAAGRLATWRAGAVLFVDVIRHRPSPWGGFMRDFKDAVRSLAASRGFAIAAILSIALAIGANTTIFGLVSAVLFDPLPIADSARVMSVMRTFAQDGAPPGTPPTLLPVSYPNYRDLGENVQSFSHLAAATFGQFNLASAGEPLQAVGEYVTGNYFDALGLRPQHGRFFTAREGEERGAHPLVVVSDGLWRRQWAADPNLVGADIRLNGRPFTVIGIASPGFAGLQALFVGTDLWVPVSMYSALNTGPTAGVLDERALRFFAVVGRLAPGASQADAQAELAARAERLARQYPDVNRGRGVRVMPVAHAALDPNQRSLFERAGAVLMGAVGLVLIVASANLSHLMLVRARRRRRDYALRVALGASRFRLARQQLTESLVIAGLGGLLGALFAWGSRGVIWNARPPFLEQAAVDLAFDGRLAAFTVLATVGAGILFGLAPALQAARGNLAIDLRNRDQEGGRTSRFDIRNGLVAVQVALCLVALAAAGAFVDSLRAARQIDPGFDHDRLLVLGFDAGAQGRGEAATLQFYQEVIDQLEVVPGVAAAALASSGPLAGGPSYRTFADDGTLGPDGTYVPFNAVTPEYRETVGLRLTAGRWFDDRDRDAAPDVIVVNETLANRLWPGESALGRRLRVPPPIDITPEIVGVVSDVKYTSLGEPPTPYIYYPLAQRFSGAVVAHLRTTGAPASLGPLAVQRIRAIDATLPLGDPQSVEAVVRESLWAPALAAWLLGLFGLIAAALAVTGIYAVISQTLTHRRHEIGVRLALGARPGEMAAFIARAGLLPVAGGLALGIAVAIVAMPAMSDLLYGEGSRLPAVAAAVVIIVLAAVAACAVPARRAMRVDPLRALRRD
jgi:putative ABC transport system permease protein